jgi:hypothetical protein
MTKYITYRTASQIEGYELDTFFDYRCAHDTDYYELESREDKINHIFSIAELCFNTTIGDRTAARIYNYLEKEYDGADKHYRALEALKYRDFNN